VHPFKESCSGWLDKDEPVFGIKLAYDDDKEIETADIIEIKEPAIEFATLNPSSSESLIYTPTFQDLMGKFSEDNSKPISNATELQAFDPRNSETTESSQFPPTYSPRKFIPISPSMIGIITNYEPDEIPGMISDIKILAWKIADKIFDPATEEEAKINFLAQVYKVVQALWVHGQSKSKSELDDRWKFIRASPNSLQNSTSKWAVERVNLILMRSAKFHEMDDEDQSFGASEDEETGDANEEGKANYKDKNVTWHPSVLNKILDKTTTTIQTAHDLLETMCNHSANRGGGGNLRSQQLLQDTHKPYIAMKLASSPDKISVAEDIADELKTIVEREKSHARDAIAHEINLVRQANMRIDKTMASNMRSFQVFRLSPDLPGNISVFHCFPREAGDLNDIMLGEELDLKVKMKVVSGDDVKGYFETKLAIAKTAHELVQQLYNFWQYVSFQFRDDSWIAMQTKKIYKIAQTNEVAIQSIANIQKKFILLLVSKINNDFHQTLCSCMQANGDIGKVNWHSMESLPAKVQGYIDDREKPNFIITRMIRRMLGHPNKRNRDDDSESDVDSEAESPPKRQKGRHQKGNDQNEQSPKNKGRDDDADKINPYVRKAWKMSQKDFRRIISPCSGSCPTQDDTPLCASYLIMGRCGYGSRCQRIHTGLEEDTVQKMADWIKSCKAKVEEKKKDKEKKKGKGNNKDGQD
jgi:hypothetical protein